MASSDSTMNVIYLSLLFVGIILTTLFVTALVYNMRAFVILLSVYMLAYSVYVLTTIYLERKKMKDTKRYSVTIYLTFYNIFVMISILTLAFVFSKNGTTAPKK